MCPPAPANFAKIEKVLDTRGMLARPDRACRRDRELSSNLPTINIDEHFHLFQAIQAGVKRGAHSRGRARPFHHHRVRVTPGQKRRADRLPYACPVDMSIDLCRQPWFR